MALKQVVKHFWYTTSQQPGESAGTSGTYGVWADGAPGIIFQHHQGHSAILNTAGTPFPLSFAYGQSTRPCTNQVTGNPLLLGISFYPTAFKKLFSIDASDLTNTLLDAAQLFTPSFIEQLLHTADPRQIIRLFSQRLAQQLLKYPQDAAIDESVRILQQATTRIDSALLASRIHISQRQFQRRFKAYVGVCTETYQRIMKFQQALRLLRHQQYNKLSDISYHLDYADQSHFNREFKLFSGFTPKALQERLHGNYPAELSRMIRYD
ncbi:helix-turn-helix domain-containing protein [Chitinophaga nivalis]|uniref:AraC family transcriptional regulator n=1 Tax=Chitinophaga nivalis TaxID=2991709 RepID=A0ABT3ILG5_9BACT|nr:AraC family transcriptional regulator [Chitinophaga nivalis]MCW3465694.1 AraC family transcriptional regulator [Chitinophaga nivalis]MCW3484615.1 AraC family transcriptional regulator [Chitinophaga nivalis]